METERLKKVQNEVPYDIEQCALQALDRAEEFIKTCKEVFGHHLTDERYLTARGTVSGPPCAFVPRLLA